MVIGGKLFLLCVYQKETVIDEWNVHFNIFNIEILLIQKLDYGHHLSRNVIVEIWS